VTATVRLRGDLDIAVRSLLTEHLGPLAARRLDRLEFDLAAVTYMDAAAASILIEVARSALPIGEQPVIVGASPQIRRLLLLSGLDSDCVLSAKRSGRRAREVSLPVAGAAIGSRAPAYETRGD
jgi:anti-anti-sigma factor